jgi:hypothetical protein
MVNPVGRFPKITIREFIAEQGDDSVMGGLFGIVSVIHLYRIVAEGVNFIHPDRYTCEFERWYSYLLPRELARE